MTSKINTYFIISLIFFSLIPVQAVAPIKYYEIDSDIELRGAIFVNVNPTGFYASLNDGVIKIDSDNHFNNVMVRFKGTALNNRLKKYNGFNVGYTHISNDGITTNEIKPLEIDYQGFAYLNTDFSTIIINGMTGTTTTTLTGLSGNQSISVPDGSSYDLNITNNQEGVFSVNVFGWNYKLSYYQNTTAAFTDTQYEINNTNFPITSTTFNNIETDGRGLPIVNFTYSNNTNIPFWVEYWNNASSFKLYTKTTSGIENLSLNSYYGGNVDLSSGSSITNTSVDGSEMNDLVGMTEFGTGSIVDGIYTSEADVEAGDHYFGVFGDNAFGVDYILNFRAKGDGPFTHVGWADEIKDEGYYSTTNSALFNLHSTNGATNAQTRVDGVAHYLDPSDVGGSDYMNLEIHRVSTTSIEYYVNGALFASDSVPTGNLYPRFTGYGGDSGNVLLDWWFVNKYTVVKPTYTTTAPQHAQGATNITATITGDTNTQSYNTSQSREFTLTPTGTTNNVNINTTSTDYDITIITYWTDDTTLQTETVSNGYANQSINYTSSDYNVSADLSTTYTFDFGAQDYIGTATSTLNDVPKTTTRDGQNVNASVGELLAGTPYWWNVTVLYNNIFTLSNQSDQTAYLGISKAFTDSSYNDPDSNPIASRLWQFGDGTNSSSSNPSHTYTSSGVLSANYTVTEDAATDSQTITKEFNVTVEVQPVQNLSSILEQTYINFNWDDYSSADYWNVSELVESIPYSNTSIILDGIKDECYDICAHGFPMKSPNPLSNTNYELILLFRNSTHLIGYAEGWDDDNLNNDDYFLIGIDGENNNLSNNDRKFILNEGGSTDAKRYDESTQSWLPTSTNSIGVVNGGGVAGQISYEMIVPISEITGFVDNATIKFYMERECSYLNPTVETFYPLNLINSTDATIWKSVILTDGEVYNYIGNTSISEFNSTGLDIFSWYKHQFITINGTDESSPVYSTDITANIQHFTVSGYIKDTLGNIVSGATVWSTNGHVMEATQSDINGYYEGVNFHTGNYTIYGNKSGYAESYIDIIVTGNLTNQNVTLTAFEMTDWMLWEKLLEIEAQNEALEDDISTLNSIIWVASLLAAAVVISVIRKKIEEHE